MGEYHIDLMNDDMEVNNFSYLLYFTDTTAYRFLSILMYSAGFLLST